MVCWFIGVLFFVHTLNLCCLWMYGPMSPYSRMAHVAFCPASLLRPLSFCSSRLMIPFITIWSLLCLIICGIPLVLPSPSLSLLAWLLIPFGLQFLFLAVSFDAPEIGLMRSYISHLPLVRAPLVWPWQLPDQRKLPSKKKSLEEAPCKLELARRSPVQ